MNFLEKILILLDSKMQTPIMYGWFHILFIFLAFWGTFFLCKFGRNAKSKTFRYIILVIWLVMLFAEIYKQINYSFNYNLTTNKTWWDYQWYAFPYQLCSTPIYLLPFIVFCKEGKFRDSIIVFIGTFAMFGGLATFIYPNQVFISVIGVNLQTMIHHGLQIVVGIYIVVHERKKLNLKFFIRGVYVFLVMCGIAMILNLIAPLITNETFNMFYISPHYPCILPFLDVIFSKLPYIIFLLAYVVGFILASLLIYFIEYLIINKCEHSNKGK